MIFVSQVNIYPNVRMESKVIFYIGNEIAIGLN